MTDSIKNTNTGRDKGAQAALAVGGFCVWPEFDGEEGTDFNDLMQQSGPEAVRNTIMVAVEAARKAKQSEPPDYMSDDIPLPEIDYREYILTDDIDLSGDMGLPFKILGYNSGQYFYFPFGQQQIISLTAAGHTMSNLLQLASLSQWEDFVGGRMPPGQIAMIATNSMIRIAEQRGVFQEEDRVRGCGAWMDTARVVIHCGDKLIVDGEDILPKDMAGKYVYAASAKLFSLKDRPLNNKEAHKLRQICEMPTWENPLSGSLLAGWLVIAPICAALEWRPHIWVTGEAESGKSTIVNKIIKPVLGSVSINVDGTTSESSIRNVMGYDARPIVFDEAEGRGKGATSMDGVLMLARLASSGGVIRKSGQRPFTARSCFCFSAINPPVREFADETRISMMSLQKNTGARAQNDYDSMLAAIEDAITPDFSKRLLSRTVENMSVLLENIETFKRSARKVIKGARAADQVSTMLAGLYLLSNTNKISSTEAEKWISEKDWSDHTAIRADSDPVRLLHHISTSIVRNAPGHMDASLGSLIVRAMSLEDTEGSMYADNILRQYSIVSKPDGVSFGYRNHNMGKLLRETEWYFNWAKTLSKIDGAEKKSYVYFSPGDKQRAVRLPAYLFLDDTEEKELEF